MQQVLEIISKIDKFWLMIWLSPIVLPWIVMKIVAFVESHLNISRLGYIYLMPGVIIHECAHAIMCVITGVKITKFNPFQLPDENGVMGSVEFQYDASSLKDNLIAKGLVGLAPSYVITTMLFFLIKYAGSGNIWCILILLFFGVSLLDGLGLSEADWNNSKLLARTWIIVVLFVFIVKAAI